MWKQRRISETKLEIIKNPFFSNWSTNLLIKGFPKIFLKTKKTNGAVVFSYRPLPNILKYTYHRQHFPKIWKMKFFQTHIENISKRLKKAHWFTIIQSHYWYKTWVICLKEINSSFFVTFFNHLGIYRTLMQFQISSRIESKERAHWFISLRFSKTISTKAFIRCRSEDPRIT